MYFSKFPVTFYSLNNRETVELVTNFLLRNVISDEVKNNYSVYDLYDIRDGETPEILAFQFYGDANLHWILLHMNEILDPRFDWPLSTFNLKRFVDGKYGSANGIHHYEDLNGNQVEAQLEMFSNSDFGFLSVGNVITNTNNTGIGYVTEINALSEIKLIVTNGGFQVGDVIKLVNSSTNTATPYTVRVLGASTIPVTNYVYEDRINESKRRIKILKPRYVERLVKDFENKLAQVNV